MIEQKEDSTRKLCLMNLGLLKRTLFVVSMTDVFNSTITGFPVVIERPLSARRLCLEIVHSSKVTSELRSPLMSSCSDIV
ncbi:hypothetical protein TNCV_4567921 [Trichonephila clavipes]|nr:hypothetical protein TNCV_4567921 [Trichonephila clavipes]